MFKPSLKSPKKLRPEYFLLFVSTSKFVLEAKSQKHCGKKLSPQKVGNPYPGNNNTVECLRLGERRGSVIPNAGEIGGRQSPKNARPHSEGKGERPPRFLPFITCLFWREIL